jgi:hypothetical protein
MKTPIKQLEEALVYLSRLAKGGCLTDYGMFNLEKAIALISKVEDALLIEELEK